MSDREDRVPERENGERIETEEERRERIRRMRRRRELRRRKRRRQKILRLVRLCLIAAVIVIVIILAVSAIRKARRDRAAAAASSTETETNIDTYDSSEVLHLSFPVLTMDQETDSSETDGDTAGGTADDTETDTGDTGSGTAAEDETAAASSDSTDYQTPLTVSEFENILQDLYDRGYVLVSIYDLVQSDEEGFSSGEVAVPKGKKPLVLSQQDASYQSGYDGHPDRMIVDDTGSIACIATKTDGTTETGASDVVPCVEAFISEHPDFSYKGARGIIGATGYRGILGYQLVENSRVIGAISNDAVMQSAGTAGSAAEESGENGTAEESGDSESAEVTSQSAVKSAEESTAADLEESLDELASVVSRLRGLGWQFACNSYDDLSYAGSYDLVKADVDQWESEAGKALGTTDILLMARGGDLDGWREYQDSNEKYQYLRQQGFRYFCVENDEELTWAQVRPGYLRLGMHEIDSTDAYRTAMSLPQ